MDKFRERQLQTRMAIKDLLEESEEFARTFIATNDDETRELFGDEMDD